MECSLGKADWMCERCCDGCEHSVIIKPADNVQVYADGKRAKVIPVTLRIARVVPVLTGEYVPGGGDEVPLLQCDPDMELCNTAGKHEALRTTSHGA